MNDVMRAVCRWVINVLIIAIRGSCVLPNYGTSQVVFCDGTDRYTPAATLPIPIFVDGQSFIE